MLWIAGSSREGLGPLLVSRNPADNARVWEGTTASQPQVAQAVEAAAGALGQWSALPLGERIEIVRRYGAILQQDSDALAALISDETGKPRWESIGEARTAIAKVDLSIRAINDRRGPQAATMPNQVAEVGYRPLGVVVVLGPYNFPAHLPGGQIIPALLAGNTIVFKPSERTPGVGAWLVDAWNRAGLPAGVLNLVQGGRDVAEWAIDDNRIGGVMFTGSHRAGAAIHRRLGGRTDVLLTLEMGGNNPLVVIDQNDPALAAGAIVASAFVTAGQRCTCARRLIVIDDAAGQRVVRTLADRIPKIRVGLPTDQPEPYVGPLVDKSAADALLEAQQRMIDAGGHSIVEMYRSPRCAALLHPGLVDMTSARETVADEEHFGPLLQLYRAADFQQAVQWAAATRFGLAAALLGGTREQFDYFRQHVPAGVINWNRQTTGASGSLPFGGLGDSGNHRPVGFWAIDACNDPVASLVSESIHDDEFDRSQL
jgi:succinylglutamic semialdehyde dehydrogenase